MQDASPQLENGYTRIANELLEAFAKYPFNATEYKIVLFVVRKTYGWKQKEALISYGAIAKELNADIRYIKRLMNKLIQDKVIFKEKLDRQNSIGINKNYKAWRLWKTNVYGGEKTTMPVDSQPPD